MDKNIYVILGVARSGTSAITRGLQALGISLGNKLTTANKWNASGFWEDNEIVYKINERINYTLDENWKKMTLIDPSKFNDPALNNTKQVAINILNKRLNETNNWAFKDPRTIQMLPFWQSIFKTMNIRHHYLIALRNPLAVAHSYQKMTGADIEHGLLSWLMQTTASIDRTQNQNRIIVSYESMMQHPKKQLERIQNAFNLPSPPQTEIETYVNAFLDKKLHRNQYTIEELKSHPQVAIAPLCVSLYELLLKVTHDELAFEDNDFVIRWQEITNSIESIKPLYVYIDSLLNENHQLRKTAHTLQKSRLWKLIYPLRIIDNALKARKKKLKNQRLLGYIENSRRNFRTNA